MKKRFEILIIDDMVDLALSMKDILEESGYNVAIAQDRKSAMEICALRSFDLALIDLKLPDSEGLALVEELSSLVHDLEFIIITGFGTIELAAEAVRKKNIVSFEIKPIDMKRLIVLIHQIEERRGAAEALLLSEQRFQIFADAATDAIISTDENGIILYVNPEIENIFGYSSEEILGKSIALLIPDKEGMFLPQNEKNPDGESLLKGKRKEVEGIHRSGKTVPLEISFGGTSTKGGRFYISIVRDITERKLAEINLQRKLLIEMIISTISARLVGAANFDQTIFDSLKEIRSYSNANSVFIVMGDAWPAKSNQAFTYCSQGEMEYLYRQNDKPHPVYEWFLKEVRKDHELLIPDTYRMPDHRKKEQEVLLSLGIRSLLILPIRINGEIKGCFGLDNIEDPGLWTLEEFNLLITLSNLFSSAFHRRTIEQNLLESEEIHHILLESTREGIIIINLFGRITEVSNIAVDIFKVEKKEALTGRRFLEFIPPENRKFRENYMSGVISQNVPQTRELTLVRDDGIRFFAEVTTSILMEGPDKASGYLVVVRDISERKKMDKQLIHSERMVGIGVMAAGMAHEINQPLNTISLAMDNLLLSMNTGSPDRQYIDSKTNKIFDNITRIRNIIDHVRAFSKDHDDYIQSKFNINESIRNAKSMLVEQFKHKGIALNLNLDASLPDPVGNTFKFEQVIINMIINAKDAIEEKETLMENGFAKIVEITSSHEANRIFVEVKDNGIGIDPKDTDKVMLPFYSTKAEGVGSGLGLSISFGIIRDMNGSIEIQSEPMKGTTIRIQIPVKEELKRSRGRKIKK
jgi:PAS domain S-box-containing protein